MPKDLQFQIIQLPPEKTLVLRQMVLRPHQKVNECVFESDHAKTSLHLGLMSADQLVSVVSFTKENHVHFNFDQTYRLRGMATHPLFRGQGFASALVIEGERILFQRQCALIWLNARTSALDFYRQHKYIEHGDIFDLPGTGPHKVMYKFFENR